MKGLAIEVIVFGVILVLVLILLILFYNKIIGLAADFVDMIVKAARSLFWRVINPFA